MFKVGVVGAGVMGGQIAQAVAAGSELPVTVHDVDHAVAEAAVASARESVRRRAERAVEQQRLTPQQADERVARVASLMTADDSYDAFGDADLVIEAVPEVLEEKRRVFERLDATTPGHAILASNTSALSISDIATGVSVARRPRVVGMHFFWPASVMRLVEVIAGEDTSPDVVQATMNFAQQIRKSPIRCLESPGFVVNRILGSMNSELWAHHEETGLSAERIDAIYRDSGLGPMGPFEVADMIGLDTVVHVATDLRDAYGDRFHVHSGMEDLVARGHLGAKTGKGFYEH